MPKFQTPYEKGEAAFKRTLPAFLSSTIEERYVAYLDGECVGIGIDDADLFSEILSSFGREPDFIGYIGEGGIEEVSFF